MKPTILPAGLVKGYDYTGNGHNVTFGTAIRMGSTVIQGPRPPTYAGFYADQNCDAVGHRQSQRLAYIPNLGNTNLATTVGMWIKPNSGETGNYAHGLIGGRNNTAAGQIWQLGYSAGNGTLGYNWNDISGTYTYNAGLSPVQNAWNFVAMVISSNNATFYLYTLNSAGQAILQKAVNNVANTIPIYNGWRNNCHRFRSLRLVAAHSTVPSPAWRFTIQPRLKASCRRCSVPASASREPSRRRSWAILPSPPDPMAVNSC